MKRLSFRAAIMFCLIVTIASHGTAFGFTEGETIRMILGVSPGGGHDTEALGYPGTAQMSLAFESEEISYVGGTGLHHALGKQGRYYGMINDGKAVLLWQTGVVTPDGEVIRSAGTDVPAFPEIYEEVKGEEPSGRQWEAYKLVGPITRTLNRSLVFPPGVPEEKIEYVREAFDKLYADPEFKKEWERIFGLKLDYVKGGDADKILKQLMSSDGWEYIKGEFIPKLKAKG